MQTVLVTGSNGFVGRRLCRHLANSGYQVRGSLRKAPTSDSAENGPVDYVVSGNINETTDWRPHIAGTDTIIHCAARVNVLRETASDPLAEYRRINVAGTERLARQAAAAGVRRFVLISTNSVTAVEAHRPGLPPPTPYQISKRESEIALFRVAEETGIEAVGSVGDEDIDLVENRRNATFPVATLGLNASWAPLSRMVVRGSIGGLYVKISSITASVGNANAGVEYFFTRGFGAGVGYAWTKLQVEESEDPQLKITYRYSGLLLFGVFALF